MKRMIYFAFLVLLSCGQQKAVELAAVDTVKQDTLVELVPEVLPVTMPSAPEQEPDFRIIPINDNIVLAAVASYPFSKELYEIKSMLDSLGIKSEFIDGENGGLSYDSVEISCNRSYGESICEADVQSGLITLSNGMKIGISLDDFLFLTGIKSVTHEQNVRYEYTHGANEHSYVIQFDFVNNKLVRFHYLKDPCVIYD